MRSIILSVQRSIWHLRRGRRSPALGVALLLATALLAMPATAQTSTGTVRGYVTSTSGTPVADAQVTARHTATNQLRGGSTSSAGAYVLGGLRPGVYEISV